MSAGRSPAEPAEIRLCLNDRRLLVYRSKTLLLISARKCSVKKKNVSPLIMTIGRRSNKVIRTIPGGRDVIVGVQSLAKAEYVIKSTRVISGALQSEPQSAFLV